MIIIKPYAIPIQPFNKELLNHVEWCARISHRSEDSPPDTENFIRRVVIEHGDWSVTEHINVSCDFYVDRGITHEIVRHRIASYTQESTRFVNYAKKMPPKFICPFRLNWEVINTNTFEPKDWTQVAEWLIDSSQRDAVRIWFRSIIVAEESYKELIGLKIAPQIARSIFPNALASRIIVTYNLRQWRHFFMMRTTNEAHPQMREVTIPLLEKFKETIPILYDDLEIPIRQVESLRRPR